MLFSESNSVWLREASQFLLQVQDRFGITRPIFLVIVEDVIQSLLYFVFKKWHAFFHFLDLGQIDCKLPELKVIFVNIAGLRGLLDG